jgi:excisionase family DNA binding protein
MSLHEAPSRSLQPLLSPKQVAEHLGISRRAVQDLARAYVKGNPKGLPGVKITKEWRFTAEDVHAFLEANRSVRAPTVPGPRVPVSPGDTGLKSVRSKLLQ